MHSTEHLLVNIRNKLHWRTDIFCTETRAKLEMWVNAQRDGRSAEYRWRPLFNATKFGRRPLLVPCSNAANTRNPLKLPGVPKLTQRSQLLWPKFTIL